MWHTFRGGGGGPRFVTVCDRGRGRSKIIKKSVTYFMDGPIYTISRVMIDEYHSYFVKTLRQTDRGGWTDGRTDWWRSEIDNYRYKQYLKCNQLRVVITRCNYLHLSDLPQKCRAVRGSLALVACWSKNGSTKRRRVYEMTTNLTISFYWPLQQIKQKVCFL